MKFSLPVRYSLGATIYIHIYGVCVNKGCKASSWCIVSRSYRISDNLQTHARTSLHLRMVCFSGVVTTMARPSRRLCRATRKQVSLIFNRSASSISTYLKLNGTSSERLYIASGGDRCRCENMIILSQDQKLSSFTTRPARNTSYILATLDEQVIHFCNTTMSLLVRSSRKSSIDICGDKCRAESTLQMDIKGDDFRCENGKAILA